MTHRNLCILGARYMKKYGIKKWEKPTYVVIELNRSNAESPDVFGFGSSETQLIEVKVSREDFLKDKNKWFRKKSQSGIGELRSYLCPFNLIKVEELPPFWGLLYIDEDKKIVEIKTPENQISSSQQEMNLVASILRREGIKSKIFDYKK